MPKAKVNPSVISYSATISACEKALNWKKALALFSAMPKAKVTPDVIIYSAAISACEKGGQWEKALNLFHAMPEAKLSPDAITRNSTISAFEKAGQWQKALGLFTPQKTHRTPGWKRPSAESQSSRFAACGQIVLPMNPKRFVDSANESDSSRTGQWDVGKSQAGVQLWLFGS